MYLYIETLKRRMDAMNQLRVERALAAMGPAFHQVYSLLPVLLNYNHPMMPGYLDDTVPCGVCLFTPDEMQQQFIDDCSRAWGVPIQESQDGELPITAIYSMGSTSSVGQSSDSDLDIWICHQSWLDRDERQRLLDKCMLLEQWARSRGVDISFFLIDENRFRHNEYDTLSTENCGSMQHLLLLDEFYRTAVRLAGKRILWSMVPVEMEEQYDEYVLLLYAQGALNANEWLDLGGLGKLSAAEYYGASLWQLYKSIDSPYKAVLKSLLLEAYSCEYPETQLLALEMKQCMHEGNIIGYGLDAYSMMLGRVTRYLQSVGDETRLDLARRCFYLKVCEKLSQPATRHCWRREILQTLVADWGWSEAKLRKLDDRANWKIEQVREAHNELLDALMQSYRNLIRFARRHNISVSASPEDIGVLTRKLYAAFEVLPGKVTLVNPQISPDLSERDLTFIQVPEGRSNPKGWYLYNKAPLIFEIAGRPSLEYNRYLSKLVAWSYFNGLLTPQSRLHVQGSGSACDTAKLRQLVEDIRSHFPIRRPMPSQKDLYSPCEIRHLGIIINLEVDPTADFNNSEVRFDFSQTDVFSFGQQQQSLIGSIDLLYRNSWNEVRTLHFRGEECLLDAIKTILGKMHQDAALPEAVDVFCYSRHLRAILRNRVSQVVAECIDLRLSSECPEPKRFKPLRVAGQMWGLFFERRGVSVQKLENGVDFYGCISNTKLHGFPLVIGTAEPHLPPIVDAYASEGLIQFFFEDSDRGFNIYILDEANRIEVYQNCEGNKDELVQDVNRFYAAAHDKLTVGASIINFNLPQFYQVVQRDGRTQIDPYRSGELREGAVIDPTLTFPPEILFNLHQSQA
ncbi:MAG: class I adenylate cyclase [Plesiomonas sp.]